MIRIAVSPLRTQYPNASQALNPATNVACGQDSATSSWLLSDRRARPPRARTRTHRCQPSELSSCWAAWCSRSWSAARRCSRSVSVSRRVVRMTVGPFASGPPGAGQSAPLSARRQACHPERGAGPARRDLSVQTRRASQRGVGAPQQPTERLAGFTSRGFGVVKGARRLVRRWCRATHSHRRQRPDRGSHASASPSDPSR